METYERVKTLIADSPKIAFEDSFKLAKKCGALLNDPLTEAQGRDIVIRVLDAWGKIDKKTHGLWNDLVEASGLYPYVEPAGLTGSGIVRHEFHKSPFLDGVYLHREQMRLSTALEHDQSVIVSAPTSFGKSLLIEEVVASRRHKNIVIIQPTLALLDETRKKLQKYRQDYNIIVSTFQNPSDGPNIFLFTGERVVEYKAFPKIDFFVIDEFYKLSAQRDDERSTILNQALYKLLKMTGKFYMLGPNVKGIPEGLKKISNSTWHKTNFSTVAIDVELVKPASEKSSAREHKLLELLRDLTEPTLIYCASPAGVTRLAGQFSRTLTTSSESKKWNPAEKNKDTIQWIAENIHPEWLLAKTLKAGVGFHHGALPRHLGSSVVDAFNDGGIKYLFCTSTLIEGVNTTAKNIVLFDKRKGLKPIDFFDYRNIIGRSGRMKKHFIGKVYQFNPEPLQVELELDVPLFNSQEAPLELLIQMAPEDLDEQSAKRVEEFHRLDPNLQAIFKANAGLPIEGQLKILDEIKADPAQFHPLLAWSKVPKYPQLHATLDLAWRYFLKPGESKGGIRKPSQLAVMTLQYCAYKSVTALIKLMTNDKYWMEKFPDSDVRVQEVVDHVLQVSRNWFEYKLPKFLSALSELQEYAFNSMRMEPGNYKYLASLIESSFLPANLTTLLEYDVPTSAIKKLEGFVDRNLPPEKVMERLREIDFQRAGFMPYEINKLKSVVE